MFALCIYWLTKKLLLFSYCVQIINVFLCVSVYHPGRYNTSVGDRCSGSACSHLCLLVPGGRICACPEGSDSGQGGCGAASERPRPAPLACPCRNGGQCREPDTSVSGASAGALSCDCPAGYVGDTCDVRVARPSSANAPSLAAVLLPILLVLLIALAATVLFIYIRKRPL